MLDKLLLLTLALVIGHQIDAAYWHEWDMFALPGGIQLFDLINVILFVPLLAAFSAAMRRSADGYRCAQLIGAVGLIIGPIHAGFALAGFEQFQLPVSIALIIAPSICGAFLLGVASRHKYEFGTASGTTNA